MQLSVLVGVVLESVSCPAPLALRAPLALPPLVFRGYLIVVIVMLLRQQLRPIRPSEEPSPFWLRALGAFLIGLHMGYVQVGTGLVATLVLAKAYDRDLLAVNTAKSIVVIVTAVTSATSLTIAGAIAWTPALSLAAGCAAVLSLPPDIVLNRYQGAPRMGVAYRSVAHCLSELVRNEGGLALFRGLGPQYAKLAPIFLFTLPLYEQLRRLAGLGYLK